MPPQKPAQRIEGVLAFGADGVVDVPDEQPPEVSSEHVSLLPLVPLPSEDEPL
jgi:hypothetical protein